MVRIFVFFFNFLKKKKGHISILPNLTKIFGKDGIYTFKNSRIRANNIRFFNALTNEVLFCLIKCPSEIYKAYLNSCF